MQKDITTKAYGLQSKREKSDMLQGLQKNHENASSEIVHTVFSANPGIRDELIKPTQKNPITMVDFADIPNQVSDQSLLHLIANMLDRDYDVESRTLGRTNKFIIRDDADGIVVSPEMLRVMEHKVGKAISVLLRNGLVSERDTAGIKRLFICDNDDEICFKNQQHLIDFMRKTPIKHSALGQYRKTRYILIVCAILKQMLREHDFKAQRHYIHTVREQLEKFIRSELVGMLEWEGIKDDVIQDLSHCEYFNDKIFIFRRNLLKEYGITYPKDIRIKLAYRSKQDKSIQDKLIIEPTVKTVDVLHDLGGIKYVVLGEDQRKQTAILLYVMFLLYANKEQKFDLEMNGVSPANYDGKAFMPGGKYAENEAIIESFLNSMSITGSYNDAKSPLYKDSGLLLLDPKSTEGKWEIDTALYDELGIKDTRYRYLLQLAVKKKNKAFKDKKEEIARKLDTQKMNFFLNNVCKEEDKQYGERIWLLIKKYDEITKKIKNLDAQNVETANGGEKIDYKKSSDGWSLFHKENDTCNCALAQLQDYFQQWKIIWDQYQSTARNRVNVTSNKTHKGSWKVGKLASNVKIGYQNNEQIPIEHQILGEDELKTLPIIDEHVIYNPSKQLSVYGRNNSGVLSLEDIEYIVDTEVMRQFERYPDKMCEKGMTLSQLQKEIEADNTLLPVGGSLREKVLYNYIHHRGLKQHGYVYLTEYFSNLQAHGLTPNN